MKRQRRLPFVDALDKAVGRGDALLLGGALDGVDVTRDGGGDAGDSGVLD
jgi:hypothetical protein